MTTDFNLFFNNFTLNLRKFIENRVIRRYTACEQ